MRKHRTAIAALVVYNLVFFFPLLFMGRVLSPNDVFYNYEPWASARPSAAAPTQNSLLNDLPTGYYTMMSLVREDPGLFHWDPYIGAGIPGFGSAAAACLSPFVILPLVMLPLAWIYTALAFLKLNAAFVFAYLWLREERLGRNGAAIGAIVVAGAGAYSIRWLWQITNATALYPALLWITVRTFRGRRVSIALTALVAFAYAVSGFPAAMAYGAWVVVARALALALPLLGSREGRRRILAAWRPAAGVVIGLMLALPTLVPFAQLVERTGYLEIRKSTSLNAVFPLSHLESFVRPDRLGNPAYRNWFGDRRLGMLDNYVEATVYAGLLTLVLAAAGLFNRRARSRWFWLGVAAVSLAAMFGFPPVARLLAEVPGVKYSALARLGLVLPLPLGYLAGAARLRKEFAFQAAAIVIAFDLALFAGRFHPYLPLRDAGVPDTPMVRFLQADGGPFRVAAFFDYLWPNTAELARVEDVRSHFGSEAAYRRMMLRIDPSSWNGTSTLILLNSLKYDFSDPLNGLLGIRWFVEHRQIDIVKWTIFGATIPGVKETGSLAFKPGDRFERTIEVTAEPFWAIEVPARVEPSRSGRLEVRLLRGGRLVWSRAFTADDAKVMNKLYVPLRPFARYRDKVTLQIRSVGLKGSFLEGENGVPGETPLFYGRVMVPIIFDRELPDGRLFRNVAELPRFRAVSRLRKLNDEQFLATRDIDFEREAVITDGPVVPPQLGPSDARVTLTRYSPAEQRLVTEADAPFFLASSEKLTPELGIEIDGREVRPIGTDMIFAGVPVPAGRHEVVFTRRIARGWWWVAGLGVSLLALGAAADLMSSMRGRSRSAARSNSS